ncbi:signal peptidase I [Halomicrobium salinisoli]|uniref:signal peptidase I n=1 Tax=Halomicrobium salinisoli TaxID=2878391 RepID=UPI001CEFE56C|nr:signal peptidase I [Halomicrobium salinisoli]
MGLGSRLGQLIELLVAALVLAMIAGQLLGQPAVVGYVETGSMAPTLAPGDGFVAVPAALAGPIEEGDVVTFRAEQLHGGGLTTHRVVGETERGYVTRGDANPFTDQDGVEPPVKDDQIVAVAWRPGGEVLVLPGIGAAVTGVRAALEGGQTMLAQFLGTRAVLGTQGFAYLLFAVTGAYYVVSTWRDDGAGRDRTRERDAGVDPRTITVVGTLAVVLVVTAAMVGPSGAQRIDVVSAEFESPNPGVIERGTTGTVNYTVTNDAAVPAVVYLESNDGVAADPSTTTVSARTERTVVLAITAPGETGHYRYYLTERRYLAVLPTPLIDALYRLHPWLPVAVIDAVLGGVVYLALGAALGSERARSRSRDRSSWLRRLRSRVP